MKKGLSLVNIQLSKIVKVKQNLYLFECFINIWLYLDIKLGGDYLGKC